MVSSTTRDNRRHQKTGYVLKQNKASLTLRGFSMQTNKRMMSLALALLVFDVRAQAQEDRSARSTIPTPRSVLGFDPGEDRKLAEWNRIVDYFKRLDSASERISVFEPGLSTERRPFIYAVISSAENIRNLSAIRENQRKLA